MGYAVKLQKGGGIDEWKLLWTNPKINSSTPSSGSSVYGNVDETIQEAEKYQLFCITVIGRAYGGTTMMQIYNMGRFVNNIVLGYDILENSNQYMVGTNDVWYRYAYHAGRSCYWKSRTVIHFDGGRAYADGGYPIYIYGISTNKQKNVPWGTGTTRIFPQGVEK